MTEAILLVGGQGTRLRPLTVHTPKPLLPVGGVPFLAHQLARLRDAGVEHVVLATSYRAGTFDEVLGDGSAYGLRISHVTEREPLGTGGAIRNAASHLQADGADAPVVVLNGDILGGHDIAAQVAFHRRRDADVTLHLVEVVDARPFGSVPTDADGRVTAFVEKSAEPVTNQVNAGCYVFRRSTIDGIPAGRVSVERETFPGLLAAGARVVAWQESAYWLDIGSPAALVRASCDVVLGRVHSSALPGPTGDWLALRGALIEADAWLSGGSAIGAGATVGSGAVVEESVLLDGAVVEAGARVRLSVVGLGARIGPRCVLDGAVVGDRARIGAGNELRAGLRVSCDATVSDEALRFGG